MATEPRTTSSGRRLFYFYDPRAAVHASVEASLVKPSTVRQHAADSLASVQPARPFTPDRLPSTVAPCRLAHELISAYDLSKHLTVCLYGEHWASLSSQEFTRFHTDAYVKFLQQV